MALLKGEDRHPQKTDLARLGTEIIDPLLHGVTDENGSIDAPAAALLEDMGENAGNLRVAAAAFDERALFHLLNLAREDGAFVLLTARSPPGTFVLRDLASRIAALPVVALAPPDDMLLRAVLVKLFGDRQLAVDESLIGYVAMRIERSFAAARAAVARLDDEAMRRKRPLTRAFAAETLRVAEP